MGVAMATTAELPYLLLGDEPAVDGVDPLGFSARAESLTAMILDSLDSTPYAVGIEGGWGSGKSTLMRRIKNILDNSVGGKDRNIRTVWYNAWTAERDKEMWASLQD